MIEEHLEKLESRLDEQDRIINMLIKRCEDLERKIEKRGMSQSQMRALSMITPIGGG